MRTIVCALAALLIFVGGAHAAMYGDFLVPDAFNPGVVSARPDGQVSVVLSPPGEAAFVVRFPAAAEDWRPWPALQGIGVSLTGTGELAVFNLGGRGWFGRRSTTADGVVVYDGYVHRNGFAYNVAFTLRGMDVPNPAVKQALAGIHLLPDLNGSPAESMLGAAAQTLERGQWEAMAILLDEAERADAGNWVVPLFRGRAAEAQGEHAAALANYQEASARKPDDIESAARAAAMTA